jgi:stage V sporulation protein SpoVS
MNIQVLKVAGDSNINTISEKAIEYVIRDGVLHLDCIGVKATYSAVKAIIQITEYLINKGYKFNLRPYYTKVEISSNTNNVIKTAIRWTIIAKKNNG